MDVVENSLRYEGWRVAAVSAVTLSFAAYVAYASPVFLKPLAEEFGWSREAISFAYGVNAAVSALCAAPLGYYVDRLGAARIVTVALVMFGLVFASLATLTQDVRQFYVTFGLLGAAMTGILPIAFARAVSSWFDRRRGIALAVAISGGSIGGLVQPPVVQFLLGRVGWRPTALMLGAAVVVVGAPLARRFLRERPSSGSDRWPSVDGVTVGDAVRSRAFWTITVVFFCSTFIQYGAVVHLSALLTDRGVSVERAALALSAFGGASLLGRLVSGALLDRIHAARVACALLAVAGLGALMLAGAQSFAVGAAAAFMIGFGTAGETDVVPYLLTHYFGLRSSSTLYGLVWIATSLGAGAGPVMMGRAFDLTGSYETLLIATAMAMLGAGAVMLTLPRYAESRRHAVVATIM